jgi:hypothetical protein
MVLARSCTNSGTPIPTLRLAIFALTSRARLLFDGPATTEGIQRR